MKKLERCRECGHEVSKSAKTCPNCGVGSPVKVSLSIIHIIGIVFLGFVLWILLGEPAPPPPPKEVMSTTYKQVMSDYKENGLAADEKYKNKLVSFTADFYSVTQGIGGDTVYAFEDKEAIIAIFDYESEPVLKTFKQGDRIKMTCSVAINGMALDDCTASKS